MMGPAGATRFIAILTLAALVVLTGCGRKPTVLRAPTDAPQTQFPRTYPAPTP